MLGGDSTFGGDLVDEVVVADVIGVTVSGEQQQALCIAEFVHRGPQGLAEGLGDAGIDDHYGVTGSVDEGVGDVGLFGVDVQFLPLHQQVRSSMRWTVPTTVSELRGRRPMGRSDR